MEFMVTKDIESVMEIMDSTMEDLAEELGVSRITISNWVNNKNVISEKHMIEIRENDFYKDGVGSIIEEYQEIEKNESSYINEMDRMKSSKIDKEDLKYMKEDMKNEIWNENTEY